MMQHGERLMEEEMEKLVDGHSSSLKDALLAAVVPNPVDTSHTSSANN
jgi:hypothetical protein